MQDPLTTQEATAAVLSPPKLVRLGAQEYIVSKATPAQLFEIYDYAVTEARKLYNPFREVCSALDGLPVSEEQKTALLMRAHAVKLAGEVPPEDVSAFLKTPKGLAYYLWVLARGNHPGLQLEGIEEAIDDANRIDLFVQLDEASGANLVMKVMSAAGFFPQASAAESTG